MSRFRGVLVGVVTCWPAVTCFGQLTAADIAALQAQGQAEGWTFTVGPNPATQRPLKELCGAVLPKGWEKTAVFDPCTPRVNALQGLPSSWDWRTRTGCPPIRNQGSCGSCWAFGTVGALECSILIKDGIVVDLSEQWLVSCNRDGMNCENGGTFAHDYHQWKTDRCGGTGAVLESEFPYLGVDGTCNCPYSHPYRIDSWAYIGSSGIPPTDSIKQAIIDYGPVSVAVYSTSAFSGYTGGVFNACHAGLDTNHIVVLVGWDDAQGPAGVWILRNSWGSGWGEGGYMRITYGCSAVGLGACYVNYRGRPGITERVSVATAGTQGNAQSGAYPLPAISADGRYVAFDSLASNLVPGDTNAKWDVFVRDRQTGTTERVSLASDGQQGTGDSDAPVTSADGRYVAFRSTAANLVPGDTNAAADVFVRDRQTGVTERVSVATGGGQGNAASGKPFGGISISADGRYVAFVSSASNLVAGDTNGADGVFVRDRQAGTTERISISSEGLEGNGGCLYAAISADGRCVAFYSTASNLVPGDTNGVPDIFLRDRQAGTTERVSIAFDGQQGNAGSIYPAISGDGRFVAFSSNATNLVSGGTTVEHVFVRDRIAGTTECASLSSSGALGNNSSWLPSVSTDGRYVEFGSVATNLVPGDTNTVQDVFVHDRLDGTTERVSVSADWQQGNGTSGGAWISGSGRYVALGSTASNLVPNDTNGYPDIFLHDCGSEHALTPAIDRVSLSVPEAGTATFQVKLSRQPASNALVSVARVGGSANISVQSGASLTFTPANWNSYQAVTLAAAADPDGCNESATIRCTVLGGAAADVTATEQDRDAVAFVTDQDSIIVPEGATSTLGVKLSHQPCADISVSVTRADGSDSITIQAGSSLVFSPATWDTYQQVVLASARDPNIYGETATIRLSAAGLSNKDVSAIQEDDGIAGDFDHDGDVDQADFGHLQACMTGFINPIEPACRDTDIDGSDRVTASDLTEFIRCLGGADVPPACP